RIIAISQMQPTDARKSFPCFDEPAFKATFKIFLWHKDPNYALSNMPFVITEERYGGWKRTEFEPTLRMSTYLLAFVVSEFGYEQSFTSGTPPTRIYARPEQVLNHNVEYAKNITPVILDYYESYFGVDYPLPKSDQIAVPDFALGGMENWGLVMYRETALLFDAAINSAYSKQRVARVIAHELSHQWFGDLITPLWWDELWLNEGFATFIEYIGTDYVEPGFRMMDQFVLYDLHDALTVDALTTSRPIIAENVTTPDDINALFDDISYSKGGCFIRMISEFAGEEAFKLGLKVCHLISSYYTINTACSYGSIDCIEHAQTLFHTWMADPSNNTISPNLRDAVYCQAVANGGSDEWDFIWGRYQTEGDSHEKSALQSALACTKQLWIIQRYLEYTLDSTLVRNQDAYSVYVGLCGNDYARDLTWDFLRREWDYIYEVYGSGFFRINSIIEGCTSRFSTEFELKELETFKESRSDQLGTGARSVDQALELTKTNIQWRTDYEDTVFSWLN
uniref:Aminopeptidase n=1 Tax=Ciona savignyi TaxID=51511 RepID=H2Y900_CIOSA